MRKFIIHEAASGHIDYVCPKCASLPRQRFLHELIKDYRRDQEVGVLHFSPNAHMKKEYQGLWTNYYDSNFEDDNCRYQFDILNIDLKPKTIDMIICFHVLEHINNDKKAFGELFRILKSGGKLIAQVPASNGKTVEFDHELNKEDRIKFYGQEDHVRYYGKNDFKYGLEAVGFEVDEVLAHEILEDNELEKRKIAGDNWILVAKRP